MIKIIHVKSQSSVALPIYTANLSHLKLLKKAEKGAKTAQKEVSPPLFMNVSHLAEEDSLFHSIKLRLVCPQAKATNRKKEDTSQTESSEQGEKKAEREDEEEDEEEIPQLVPMATPSKKPKLQVSTTVLASVSFLMYLQ